jgi:uncharacterized membrane protein
MDSTWLPVPLHAAVVHLPIALTVLAPLVAVVALVAIRRQAPPRATWMVAIGTLVLLLGSGFAAKETGEDEEEIVEKVVAEATLESHEEAADQFLVVTGVVLAVALAGLARGRLGDVARVTATVGTVALVWVGYNVGHSGGRLAYQEGGASAYRVGAAPAGDLRGEHER